MSTLITTITSVVTASAGWVSTYVSTITEEGNEVLLLMVVIPVVGLGVGLLRRLIRV